MRVSHSGSTMPANGHLMATGSVRATGSSGGSSGVTVVQPKAGFGCGSPSNDTTCCVGGPEAACGGVGSVCCEGSGQMVTTMDWNYVGQGRGDSIKTQGYHYVGVGSGNYTKETIVTPYGCRLRPCCLAFSLLMLFPLLYYVAGTHISLSPHLSQVPQPAPVPPPRVPLPVPLPAPRPQPVPRPMPAPAVPNPAPQPQGPFGVCTIWGDPHIRTFDGLRSDYYSPGEYWIVKSQNVWIQGRYLPTKATNGLAVTKILAVGGPFLKNAKLLVSPTWASWNGKRVLQAFPSDFSVPGLVQMRYDGVGELLQKGRTGMAKHIVHINVVGPEGVVVQINRWTRASEGEYINAKISMHAQPGQDGHCGNFNHNADDDDRLKVRARVGKTGVLPKQLLFKTKTPIVVTNRPSINDCPSVKLDEAKASCKAKEGAFIPSMACLVDFCFAGKNFAMQG